MRLAHGLAEARVLLRRSIRGEPQLSPELRRKTRHLFGDDLTLEQVVERIIADIATKGDVAVRHYNSKIDGVAKESASSSLVVSRAEIEQAYTEVDNQLIQALRFAARRIEEYHTLQREHSSTSFVQGGLRQSVRPLKRVGVYVPGTSVVYPSTVLMTAIPAKVAGVEDVAMATPVAPDASVSPLKLVAADIAGVNEVYRVGGVQGLAALAYGTESVVKVDKICGPGNVFVTTAKRRLYGLVGIDGIFGPSETVVLADQTADPSLVASDLLAAAEHDELASSILISTSKAVAQSVLTELEAQVTQIAREHVARNSLAARGIAAVLNSVEDAVTLADEVAPEHLCLHVVNAESVAETLSNVGAIFVGKLSAESIGDYAVGPSHLMPTGGSARFASPLGIQDFLKVTSVVSLDSGEVADLGPPSATIAWSEGFQGHARAIERRMSELG